MLVPLPEAQWVLDQAFRRARTALDIAATVSLEGGPYMVEFHDGSFRHSFGRSGSELPDQVLGLVADIRLRAVAQGDPNGLSSDDGGEL